MAMAKKDYYEILGVRRGASGSDIKSAYKRLARKYHPDVNPENKEAEARFKGISEAYAVLGDSEKRKQYDRLGASGFNFAGARGRAATDYSDIFSQFDSAPFADWGQTGGTFGDHLKEMFSELFGGASRGRGSRPRSRRCAGSPGSTVARERHAMVTVSLAQSQRRHEQEVRLPGGRRLSVSIPAGIRNGDQIRLSAKSVGLAGRTDLYLDIRVEKDPRFVVEGDDLSFNLPISIPEALRGETIRIPTIGKPVELKLPRCAQNGKVLKLRGKGLVNRKTSQRGDMFVKLDLRMPDQLSGSHYEALLKVMGDADYNPREGSNWNL